MEDHLPKSIGFEIKDLSILIGRSFDKKVLEEEAEEKAIKSSKSRHKLTVMQSHVIDFIYDHTDYTVSQKELEVEFRRKRSTITGILKLMEKNGYITRVYSKTDNRVKMVTLTDKAISFHDEIMSKIVSFSKSIEKGLSQDDIETFYMIASKIRKNLE